MKRVHTREEILEAIRFWESRLDLDSWSRRMRAKSVHGIPAFMIEWIIKSARIQKRLEKREEAVTLENISNEMGIGIEEAAYVMLMRLEYVKRELKSVGAYSVFNLSDEMEMSAGQLTAMCQDIERVLKRKRIYCKSVLNVKDRMDYVKSCGGFILRNDLQDLANQLGRYTRFRNKTDGGYKTLAERTAKPRR